MNSPVIEEQARGRSMSITWLYLSIILIIGGCIRFYRLDHFSLWVDEIHSMNGANPDHSLSEVIEYAKTDQPPLYFVLLHYWLDSFGYNDLAGRSLSAVLGLLGIISIFFLGKAFSSNRVGLLCAFITSINYFHIDLSREARFYPLVFILSCLSYLFYVRSIRSERWTDFFLYMICTGLLLNTHYFGMVVFISQFLLYLIIHFLFKKKISLLVKALLSGVGSALMIAHWLSVIFSDLKITEFHVEPVQFYFPAMFHWVYFREIVTCIVFAFFGITFVKLFLQELPSKLSVEKLIIVGWIVFGFLIPLVYSLIKIPLLTYKYSFIVLPAVFLLIAVGFDTLNPKLMKFAISGLFILACLNLLYIKPLYDKAPIEQWKEGAAVVSSGSKTASFARYAWYYNYYLNLQRKSVASDQLYCDNTLCNFHEIVSKVDSIWLLRQSRYPDPGFSEEQSNYVMAMFNKNNEVKFADATCTLFIRRR
ncbi:MAG: glycosyltransferase family 39 protein [Cyclobacteriaceae bacterium]|nr:glycosyltransferase family 39 protein [Cyclobacteriaceae bacterium]